jgi:polyisoprenyl-phosphate glycosyltransferase
MAALLLSLVVPVFNEEESVELWLETTAPFIGAAVALMGPDARHEIVFVDDGSVDSTLTMLTLARHRHPEIRIVSLSRNFGKDAALSAGLAFAQGDAVIPMDVDLQDPPALIPLMVEAWLQGAQVVNAVRASRGGDGLVKRLTAGAFYWAYNNMADRPISPRAGDYRLIDRSVLAVLNTLPERSRFMKGLFSWVGFRTVEIEFVRPARARGSTKWNYWKLWNFALDGITASTTTPLRVWSYIGALVAILAFALAGIIVLQTVLLGRDVPGYASLMVAVLMIGGLQLVALGVLGEYIGRIANEVKARPLYIVGTTVGFEAAPHFAAITSHRHGDDRLGVDIGEQSRAFVG